MESCFKLKENGTKVSTEIIAGLTTFFAMSYIVIVNPNILSQTGMGWGAVYLATIISSVVGTLIMGLYANVPYAQAPGMGLNAFFTYTVCFTLGFTWQQALSMVFICGLINILITVTKVRKAIIKSIPPTLQHAISGGIGIFIAYIGMKNAGLLSFTADPGTYSVVGEFDPEAATVVVNASIVPALVDFNTMGVLLALIAVVITIILLILNVKGAILIGILAATVIGIPMGVTHLTANDTYHMGEAFAELGSTFGVIFTKAGLGSLFADNTKILVALMTIFSFSLTDTFDTIGTFIGTGQRSGIFSAQDEAAMENNPGVSSKLDRALISDSVATSIGAIFGTSNTTTYVESATGIGAGGRTGLTSVVTAILFLLCIPLVPLASAVPTQATAAALIIVGVMMCSSFKEINWEDLTEAIPAFFTAVVMGFMYSITTGIAFGFITYCLVVLVRRLSGKDKTTRLHPILIVATCLFILNFVLNALF
ncbi:MAG: NCS2 family permease [Oscillospiraceae bacterium]|nr:NCS2 family permease [Oscillospiraceae bacterium]MDD4367530.1 NCS2 family permease [Oscillospiraceae bacterium]